MTLRLSVLLLLTLTACGQPRLIGRNCASPDCVQEGFALPAPLGCGVQFELPEERTAPGIARERCQLYTLEDLQTPRSDERVYVTRLEVVSGPLAHDLDLRLAPELPDFPDGAVDCAELASRAIPWLPLMTTQGTRDDWDFAPAPLVATRQHRLLINDSFSNLTTESVRVSVKVNVHCAATLPSSVSQTFEFTSHEQRTVNPGQRAIVSAPCAFSKPVLVSRLYRRTRLVSRFSARRLDDSEPLWRSDLDWFVELEPPQHFEADEGWRWECVYENRSDLPFQIGGDSSDACSLLGIYRLPSGEMDPFPERCSR